VAGTIFQARVSGHFETLIFNINFDNKKNPGSNNFKNISKNCEPTDIRQDGHHTQEKKAQTQRA
jgi:hypothetical protein